MKKSLNETVNEFIQERERVTTRRQFWYKNAKNTIKKSLEKFAKDYPPLGAKIDGHDDKKNYETVYLAIGMTPSGIETINGREKFIYIGGALHFSQSIDGKIILWMEYPNIKNLAEPKISHEIFGYHEPEEISEEFVNNYLREFISRHIEQPIEDNWENRRRIGF